MNQKAEKTRYSDEELYEFRVLIEKKLERAKEQLQFYLDQLSELADNPDAKVKGLDDGIGTVESERLTSMAGSQRRHIHWRLAHDANGEARNQQHDPQPHILQPWRPHHYQPGA